MLEKYFEIPEARQKLYGGQGKQFHRVAATYYQDLIMNFLHEEERRKQSMFLLRLKDIASWRGACEPISQSPNNIIASVPILQRGLVWRPQQIEFLWDSLFRGFPIGSLIVCGKMDNQQKEEIEDCKVTHHILDGQQRCYAIYLGFAKWENEPVVLWLDLAPELPESSSRKYLFRVTTKAHPWGYSQDDLSSKLNATDIKAALRANSIQNNSPASHALGPYKSKCPIPLSILIACMRKGPDLRKEISSELKGIDYEWAKKAIAVLESNDNIVNLKNIENGLERILATKIVAQQVPDELIYGEEKEGVENVESMEQVFHRVNRQGTHLDKEELIYSMIKAYLPEIAGKIDEIAENKMPASRLVNLAIKCALSTKKELRLSEFSISQIRKIGQSELEKKEAILKYLRTERESSLKTACYAIKKLWDEALVSYLQTSIIMRSASVYLLLLWIHKHFENEWEKNKEILLAVSTIIHWFGEKNKDRIVSLIVQSLQCDNVSLCDGIIKGMKQASSVEPRLLPVIHPPCLIKSLTGKGLGERMAGNWWEYFIQDEERQQERNEKLISPWIRNIIFNKELLLVIQKQYIETACKNFDPANKELWEEHNRPWDYDHIIPNHFYYKKTNIEQKKYKTWIGAWIHTIGNFRAIRFEENRSDKGNRFSEKCSFDRNKDFFISDAVFRFFKESDVSEPLNSRGKCESFQRGVSTRLFEIYDFCDEKLHWTKSGLTSSYTSLSSLKVSHSLERGTSSADS